MKKFKQSFGWGILSILFSSSNIYAIGSGFYVGGGLGSSNLHNSPRAIPNTSTTLITPKNTGIGGRLFLGANGEHVGFEMGFAHFAPSTFKSTGTTSSSYDIQENAVDFLIRPKFNVWKVTVSGRFGAAFVYRNIPPAIAQTGEKSSGTFIRPTAGLGIELDLSQNWLVEVSASHVTPGSDFKPINFYALEFSYHFVDEYCGQFLC